MRAQQLAQLISQHAPKLQELYLRDEDEFSTEVMEAFSQKT